MRDELRFPMREAGIEVVVGRDGSFAHEPGAILLLRAQQEPHAPAVDKKREFDRCRSDRPATMAARAVLSRPPAFPWAEAVLGPPSATALSECPRATARASAIRFRGSARCGADPPSSSARSTAGLAPCLA